MLRCSDKSIYTGFTSKIEQRINEHKIGKHPKSYTFICRPIKLVYFQKFTDSKLALDFEKRLKKWSRMKKEALIQDNFELIESLSECRNASHSKYKPKEE